MFDNVEKLIKIDLYILIFCVLCFIKEETMSYIVDNNNKLNKLPCHMFTEGKDILQSIDNYAPDDNSIFFHETSCNGYLNPRQACSIEAAALAHTNRQVFVIFNAPVDDLTNLRRVNILPNVHCVRIHSNYSSGMLGDVMEKLYYESSFPVLHAADVLRFVTLYKWGGTYLDMDTLVIKSFDDLGRKWVTSEFDDELSIGAMDFPHDDVGFNAVKMVIDEIKKTYSPSSFNFNGNGALTRAFLRLCNYTEINQSTFNCSGFQIYNSTYFYPLQWDEASVYFQRNYILETELIQKPYAHHLWNWLTKATPISPGSFYADLAITYCPNTYKAFSEEFSNEQ